MAEAVRSLLAEPAAVLSQAACRMIAVLIGLCCHEWGHAYVAYRCGDDTAKRAGRMTLNPLAHLDPVGTILMLFAGFGFAKPVPVNPYRFKGNRIRCDLFVSLAGILVNIVLFTVFTYLTLFASMYLWKPEVIQHYGIGVLVSYKWSPIWSVIDGSVIADYGSLLARPALAHLVRIAAYTALVNLNLAVFNLIPIPPLDGYHVANDILFKGKIQLDARGFRIAMLLVLALSAFGVLGRLISFVVYPAQGLLLLPFGGGL